jgi:tetratricopeptide (TPR) repeat protein
LFNEAIKLNPSFGRAYYQRAMIYQAQKKYKQAVPELEKAKRLGYGVDPDFITYMQRKAAEKE